MEEDVRIVREKLKEADDQDDFDLEREEDGKPLGLITRALDTQIKDFQTKMI